MGIGMMMPTHHLSSSTEHRPTPLEMQGDLVKIKSCLFQVDPNPCNHFIRQGSEVVMLMKLPDAIEVAGPSTTFIRIAERLAPQAQKCLQLTRQHQGVYRHPIGGHHRGEKGV